MAFEFEEAAEAAHDIIKEQTQSKDEKSLWVDRVALSTMAMALLSALGALLAGVTANDLMLERTQEILEISHMESDRINVELLKSKHAILTSLGANVDNSEIEAISKYENDIKRLRAHALFDELKIKRTIYEHELFAIGVTLLSIAITLGGMSLVAKRKTIWAIGLMFGSLGTGFVGLGVYKMIL